MKFPYRAANFTGFVGNITIEHEGDLFQHDDRDLIKDESECSVNGLPWFH
jgi:hypothetical protein